MEGLTEVGDRTYRLEVAVPGSYVTIVSYFITEGGGAVIEPGPGAAVPAVQAAIQHLGLGELAYIIPTHIHADHVGAAGGLAALNPGAQVLVHPRGARHVSDPARLIEITKEIYGEDFETQSGKVLPVPEGRIRVVQHGETLDLGGRELQILHAPGHASHQFVILDRGQDGLFCGEALGLPPCLIPSVTPYSFDQEAYLRTIEDLRRLHPRAVFYSHGGREDDPETAFSTAMDNARIYGRLVLEALRRGDSQAEIARLYAADIAQRFGLDFDEQGCQMLVTGYTMYFEKKGLD